ncbi:uncharacterized protein TRIADDRAFT_53360 [Trichoplax adhaerens]|uniref:Ubiquitin-related modifier 1 homolog n=1 Tax=Trichoplax adhaerens TaxID=10228 RepID=B3RP08_TRIAD|nr:hypothetical protein TRIADDRAFT_53360 [Trichoplax adhaerens]EDV27550.1 hypothetical protein TRIADDRAFT_53360 [Trichoplax adhaerens]|eukprot:XP_002109384.1 hypothetical protein TRIADDRAFT_53360 [Trichoplax adhaerens]
MACCAISGSIQAQYNSKVILLPFNFQCLNNSDSFCVMLWWPLQQALNVTGNGQAYRWDMKKLISWIKENLLQERPELFVQGDSVRPGILVLINESDWELLGELEYHLEENDCILFISTLHGG